jgi:hypothetical protein
LDEGLADKDGWRSPSDQRLVLQLQSQFLFLCLKYLDLLIQVVVEQVLCMLRLKRQFRRAHSVVGLAKVILVGGV